MVDISIIIVSYNCKDDLKICLDSIFVETRESSFEIFVVDNNSNDGTREFLDEHYQGVQKIYNAKNMGFAAANNQAMRLANGKYILLLNPDTKILDGAIDKTVRFMNERFDVGIAGCKMYFPDGRLQPSVFPFPSVLNSLIHELLVFPIIARLKIFRRIRKTNFDYTYAKQVDWVHGAFVLIRREVIEKIGLLDEQFYMYSEETDYCYRARKAGFQIWYTHAGKIIHHWSGVATLSLKSIVWTQRSQMLFYHKHFSGIQRYLLVLLKYIGMCFRTIAYFVLGIVLFRRTLFVKSWYFAFTIYKMSTAGWKYQKHLVEEITPWEFP
jgi:GT2 family glycosyltransferase